MRQIIIGVIIFFISNNLSSKCVTIWTERYSGSGNDYAADIVVDNNGYIYITGDSSDGSTADYFTIKYDSDGNTIWTQRFDKGGTDYARGISIDSSGNISVTGEVYDFINKSSYFTIKYDSDGNTIWTQRFVTITNDYGEDVAADNSENVYVTGFVGDVSYGGDYYTIKYNSSGVTVWTQIYTGLGKNVAEGIAVDNNGNVYVTGYSYNGSNNDYFTIKYDNNGNSIWTQRYNSGGNDYAYDILVDNNGYIYVTGSLYNVSSLDYGTIKYDSNGNIKWIQQYNNLGNDYCRRITIDSSGFIYVVGELYNGSNYDYFVMKYDSNGNTIWTQRYDSGTNDYARGIAVDNEGYVYVTGYVENGVNKDYFTIKYEQSPYPEAPSGLTAEDKDGYIQLKWNDNTINESGFKIYRSYDGISYEVIGKADKNITEYEDNSVNKYKEEVYYKISATNLAGEIESESIKWVKKRTYNLDNIEVVPNPCKISDEKITFYKVEKGMKIEIYRVSGRKVKEVLPEEGNKMEWELKDDRGREVGSGIYIAKITDIEGNKRYIVIDIRKEKSR